MSQSGVAWTPRREPSLIDMTKTLPSSMATIVCLTPPPSISFAAPTVSEPMPETIVARSALDPLGPSDIPAAGPAACAVRWPGSEESSIRPSDETTVTEWTPGTSSTRLLSNQ